MNTKSNLLKSIFISLILVMGVNNAWAYNQSAVDLYFDNSEAKWSSCYVYIGHSTWTSCYPLTRVSGTQYLWKLAKADFNGGSSWNNATGWVLCNEKWWDSNGETIDKFVHHGDKNVTQKRTSAWSASYIYKTNGTASTTSDNKTITAYKTTTVSKKNYTVTINTVEGGTLTVKDYDNNAVTSGASKIHLTVLKFSASASTGYTFGGVQINDGTNTTTIAAADIDSETYTLTSNVTITPIWTEKTYSVTISAGTGGTVSPSGSKTIGQVTKTTVTATPNANYEFVNWTTTGGVVVANTTSASTTITATAAGTLKANFRSTATHSLTVEAGDGIQSVTGSEDPVTLGSSYSITATPKTGYAFSTWTANPAANATFGSATTANTTVTVKNGSVTVTASATENTHDITILYKCEGISIQDETTESAVGEVNAKGITAPDITGYTFKEWTLGDGITNISANTTTNPISVTTKASGNYTLTANYTAKPYYIGGRFQQKWNDGSSTTNPFTYAGNGRYKLETHKTVAELSAQITESYGDRDQFFFIHTGKGKAGTSTYPFWTTKKEDGSGHNFEAHIGESNAIELGRQETNWGSIVENRLMKFTDATDNSSDVVIWWEPSTNKLWYTATANLTTNYYLLGLGSGNWNVNDARRFVKDENDPTKAKVTINLAKGDYKQNTNDGFKINDNVAGKWYGNNGTMKRSDCTGWSFTEGTNNAGLTADVAGDYVFTLDLTNMHLSVTYPEAYTVTYSRVPEAAADEPTTNLSITSGALVLSGTSMTFTAQNAKTGYTWKGWYDNSEGTGTALSTNKVYTRSIDADTKIYAVYTLNSYTITYNLNGGTNPNDAPTSYNVTTATITLPTPTKTGYDFAGWYENSSLTGTAVTQITKGTTGDKDFWAKWTAKEYTITYNDLHDVTHSNPPKYTIESETITFAAPTSTRTGYTFAGWNPASIATGSTGNQTITAQWTEILSTITIVTNPAEGGSVKVDGEDFVSGNTVQVGVATTKQVTAVPNEGYGVAAWGVSNKDIVNASGANTVTLKSDGSGSTGTLTANFIGLEYTITFDKQEGTEGTDKATVRYMGNEYSVSPVVAPTRAGYTFGGYYTEAAGAGVQVVSAEGQWLANATDYTDADRKWLVKENTTLYAHWIGAAYTVRLNQEGAATSGTEEVTATYDAAMPTAGVTMPTAKEGYGFMGYWDGKDGAGTQYYNADGTSARTWDKADNATLYAYFAVPKIDITLDKSTFEPGAENVTATATVTPTPAGTTTICWKLLYTNDNPVDNHAPSPENGNSVQFNISDLVAGTYKIKATLRMGDGCEGEEICSSEQQFLISSSHTITIKYICDGKEIQSKTTIEANVSSTTTHTAPDIVGYTFSNWEAGDGVTITGTNGKDVTFNAFYDGYLTAKYTKNSSIIYFYNTLGWENVYVYFYNDANGYKYWTDNYGTGAHQNKDFGAWDRKPFWEMEHGQMQQIEGTNIWYFQMKNKRSKVAFATVNQTYKEGDNVSNTTAYFQDAEVVYRDDLDSEGRLPMFVPNHTISHDMTNTKSKYYNHGYWMNYPDNSGYTLDLFNHHSDNDPARYFVYPYSKNTIFPLQLEVEINAENVVEGNKKIWFRIHRNDGKNFGGDATNFPTVNPTTTGGFIAENDYKVELITPIAGTYTFTLDYTYNDKTKDYQYRIDVDYPASVGDYRILYRDEAVTNWSGNTKPDGWYHPSRVIKKGEDRKDIISFYINKDVQRRLSYQTIKSIDNTTGAITWNTEEVPFNNIDWSQITTSGVYNFVFVQDGRGIFLENTIEPYTGNYYIRCDAMAGGWEDYKTNSENRMTYSSFSESDANSFGEKFSHYAVKWCEKNTNVKFTIANDYSQCISDTLAQDVIPLGNLNNEGRLIDRDIYNANIRFMWNWKTNKISRAYVGPAGDKQSQFLMLRSCSEFKDAAGNDLNPTEGDILDQENNIYAARFTDTQNWIYERTIQVKPRTRVKLYASYPKVYHIYIENKTGWQDVALYAWKDGGDQPLGNWPGIQPTRTVEIEGKTYYDFQVSEYVFGSKLKFNNNNKGSETSAYNISEKGDYYLTASNSQLSFVKKVSTTVEATAQYFRGAYAEGSCDNENTVQILGGEGDTWNTIRVIYDFKTNRLMAAWMPNNNAIDTRSIESDVMIIRDHQNAAQCITFANDDSELTEVKTVYGVMRFNRWILNNRGGEDKLNIESCTKVVNNQTVYDQETTNNNHPVLDSNKQKSQYERALYFISFPFDVHLSDVFGFGTYGQHWIIEYYDGLKRAREGYWIDSDPNWKYVTNPTDFVLKAYEGYILCLNLGKMAYDNTDFWAHNISQVELFFPSVTTMEKISKIEVTMPSLGEEYLCTINRGEGTEGDRRVKDSYWRCIGVPSYANYSNVLKDEEGNDIRWQTSYKTFPFLYAWNMTDNTLTPQSTSNFPFKTMHAYLVQNGGEIHWSAVSATPEPASIVARKEAPSNNYEWKITLTRNEQVEDQAFIRLSNDEKITNNFDFGQDLSKEFNYGRSDIYTLIGYEKAAANSLPISEQTTVIPLGLSIEYNGDYTLAMPDRVNGIGVTLVDNQTGTRTNLSAGMDYTLTLNKGDYNNRFFIEISPVQQVPTDIEYVTGDTNGKETVRKVLIDNILYIVRDGQMFDARGVRVQ